jgi:hypothetical protein
MRRDHEQCASDTRATFGSVFVLHAAHNVHDVTPVWGMRQHCTNKAAPTDNIDAGWPL